MTTPNPSKPFMVSVSTGGRKMRLLKNKFVIAGIVVVILIGIFVLVPTGADSEVQTSLVTTTTTTIVDNSKAEMQTRQETAFIKHMNVKKLNETLWINKTNEKILYTELARQEAARQAEIARQQKAAQAAKQAKINQQQSAPRISSNTPGNGQCGGNLPPCCVMNRESGGNITAQNPTSSASGKWQFLSSTWGNYMGYPTAASAPEWVQDKRAAELWAGGAGASHWGGGC